MLKTETTTDLENNLHALIHTAITKRLPKVERDLLESCSDWIISIEKKLDDEQEAVEVQDA